MAERLNALWRKETLSAEEQKDIDLIFNNALII